MAACTAYSRYILDVGQSDDWLALQIAMAPCLIGYGAIAKRLYNDASSVRDGNRYWKWIENYAADDYSESVQIGSGMMLQESPVMPRPKADHISSASGRAYERSLAQSTGRTNQNIRPSDRTRNRILGNGTKWRKGDLSDGRIHFAPGSTATTADALIYSMGTKTNIIGANTAVINKEIYCM